MAKEIISYCSVEYIQTKKKEKLLKYLKEFKRLWNMCNSLT